ncbi:ABC transporter permease [Peptostreptococcaceae bacterium AGR-M142]
MKYYLKRIISAIFMMFLISIIVFVLINLIPGNPYLNMISPSTSKEEVQRLLKNIGYFDPINIKYFKWIKRVIVLDLGYSSYYGDKIINIIFDKFKYTFFLGTVSIIITLIISILLSGICVIKNNKSLNRFIDALFIVTTSMPSFFIAMIVIKLFAWDFKLLPATGSQSLFLEDSSIFNIFIDKLSHLILPVFVLVFMSIPNFIKYLKKEFEDISKMDFIRVLKAKGLSDFEIFSKHVSKNAIIPIISITSLELTYFLGGTLITETIFVLPGIGRLNYEAFINRDYYLIMALLLFNSFLVVFFSLFSDFLYSIFDPRIKYDE